MPPTLDFYFFIGSTYTYLSVHRATALAAAAGVRLNWRPFSLRTILREQDNSPFLGKPDKLRYMWRDIERRAARGGIPFAGPAPYPTDPESRASHVATLAEAEGWCEPYVREVFRTWFLDKVDPGSPQVLAGILARVGQPADVLQRAESPEVAARYAAHTVAARARSGRSGPGGRPRGAECTCPRGGLEPRDQSVAMHQVRSDRDPGAPRVVAVVAPIDLMRQARCRDQQLQRIGISNAPARPEDTAATQHDGTSAAARSWQRCPFGAPRRSPGTALASICCLDPRVDPHSATPATPATPRPLGAQRRPAALRRCSLRMRG
ncbi:MAG: 2-hydroxychromene-2-carboxylate isomerase [Rubrivivax sp.]